MLRTIFLIAASALALSATSASAVNFIYSGQVESWTVPATATYVIDVAGAAGGAGYLGSPFANNSGAVVSGDLVLCQGEVINIVVGGVGGIGANAEGGGGGGTFVFTSTVYPLAVAGGGGGGDSGEPGQVSPSGNGLGGAGYDGAGGGGWLGSGGDGGDFLFHSDSPARGGSGPASFAGGLGRIIDFNGEGGLGGDGGFGGGGGGGYDGGGGGGGYSGGNYLYGGTSYLAAGFTHIVETAGANDGDGYVTITEIGSVPEPSTWSLMLTGVGFLGYVLRRRYSWFRRIEPAPIVQP